MISSKRQQPPSRQGQIPDLEAITESGLVKRCGVCWRLWDAGAYTIEEGATGTEERCPSCVDERTAIQKAQTLIAETEYAASREPPPQISNAPLKSTFPGTIVRLTDTNGVRISESAPLRVIRAAIFLQTINMLLVGRSFSASDTLVAKGSALLTCEVESTTATLTSVAVGADTLCPPGDRYGFTFNGIDFNNIISVR